MSQIAKIPVPNDTSVTATVYYETQYRVTGTVNFTTQYDNHPLPFAVLASPWMTMPYVRISVPLADSTAYEFMMRRFDAQGNASPYFTGTFTTP